MKEAAACHPAKKERAQIPARQLMCGFGGEGFSVPGGYLIFEGSKGATFAHD